MTNPKTIRLWGVFFCVAGSVCAVSATGVAEGSDGGLIAAPATQPAADAAVVAAPLAPGDAAAPAQAAAPAPVAVAPAKRAALPQGQTVNVGSFGQIDLHVKDLPLTKVLQLLSIQSQKNIIASKDVSGKVSADLYNVGFKQALQAILTPNGYGYRQKGNFIYVYSAAELKAIEKAERKTVTKVIRLNYMNAADASTFVSPLLSSAGSIAVSGAVPASMTPSATDAGANSNAHSDMLIVHDYPENVEQIEGVIKQLDIRPKQVLIEATILQASLSEANAFGVDFSIFSHLTPTDFTSPLGAVSDLISGAGAGGTPPGNGGALTSDVGSVAGVSDPKATGGIKLGFVGSDAAVFIRALDSVTDTTVLARPKLLVLNRQRADLLVGQKLGYLSSTATSTSTTQTVEFLDVGTQLTVRPFVGDDGFIRMELRPSVSDGSTSTVGNFVIPNETTQELTTNVIVHSGQTVVLGGLFKDHTDTGRNQVPGLGDIPIVGNAFKGHNDTVKRDEIIFLIKPSILKDKSLYAAGANAERSAELAALGARQGLLPWSRSKLSASHIKEAYKALEAGNKKKALWDVNLALYLDPTMVQAMRLKEKLTGERLHVYSRGILDSAIDKAVHTELQSKGFTPAKPMDDAASKGTSGAATQPAAATAANPATQPAPAETASAADGATVMPVGDAG